MSQGCLWHLKRALLGRGKTQPSQSHSWAKIAHIKCILKYNLISFKAINIYCLMLIYKHRAATVAGEERKRKRILVYRLPGHGPDKQDAELVGQEEGIGDLVSQWGRSNAA